MDETLLTLSTIFYAIGLGIILGKWKPIYARLAVGLGIIAHSLILIIRSIASNQPPFTSIYEAILFLTLLIMIRWMVQSKNITSAMQAFLLFTVGIINLTLVLLPSDFRMVRPATPALRSPWLFIHVPLYLLGYLSIFYACYYAFCILLSARSDNSPDNIESARQINREIKLSFFFLNAGLFTGSIWAYNTWGNYWSWDPKEVWALINILIVGLFFHMLKPRNYKKALLVVIVALSVIFTFVGVTFLLKSLHGYH